MAKTEFKSKSNAKTLVEIKKGIEADVEYFYVNGIKMGVVGFTSEEDRDKFESTVQTIIDSTDATEPFTIAAYVMKRFNELATFNEKEIPIEGSLVIDNIEYVVDYTTKVAYDLAGNEIANYKDITATLTPEVADIIITEKIKAAIALRKAAAAEEDYDYDEAFDWDDED